MKRCLISFFAVLFFSHLHAQAIAAFSRDTATDKWSVLTPDGKKLFDKDFHYIDTRGTQVLTSSITAKTIIGYPGNGLFPFKEKSEWGYIDITGKVVIAPQFYWAFGFSDSVAIVMVNEQLYQYVDVHGIPISKMTTVLLKDFSEGYGLYFSSGSWYFMNRKGVTLNKEEGFKDASSFRNGLSKVQIHGKYGIYTTKGEWKIPAVYDEIGNFSEGYFAFKRNGKWGFADMNNRIIVEPTYDEAHDFSDGMAAVKGKANNDYYKWGFIDTTGKLKIGYVFWEVNDFKEGVAGVKKDVMWGVITREGNNIVPYEYDKIYDSNNHTIAIKKGKTIRLAQTETGKIMPEIYEFVATSAADGLRLVIKNDKYGYVDSEGKLAIPAIYDRAADFKNGYARVKTRGYWGYMDTTGTFIIKPTLRNAEDFFKY